MGSSPPREHSPRRSCRNCSKKKNQSHTVEQGGGAGRRAAFGPRKKTMRVRRATQNGGVRGAPLRGGSDAPTPFSAPDIGCWLTLALCTFGAVPCACWSLAWLSCGWLCAIIDYDHMATRCWLKGNTVVPTTASSTKNTVHTVITNNYSIPTSPS